MLAIGTLRFKPASIVKVHKLGAVSVFVFPDNPHEIPLIHHDLPAGPELQNDTCKSH